MEVSLWVAVAAGAPGLIALVIALWLWRGLTRVRADQRVLLPDGERVTLLDRQATLQRTMAALEQGVADLEQLVHSQGETTERELRTALRFQGMVRYDAYRDMGGRQSWSVALLDGASNGTIITSLHARDHARVYLKEMVGGLPGQRLSPEEERAVAMALERPVPPTPERPARVRRDVPVPGETTFAPAPPAAPADPAAPLAAADPAAGDAREVGDQSTGEFPAPEAPAADAPEPRA